MKTCRKLTNDLQQRKEIVSNNSHDETIAMEAKKTSSSFVTGKNAIKRLWLLSFGAIYTMTRICIVFASGVGIWWSYPISYYNKWKQKDFFFSPTRRLTKTKLAAPNEEYSWIPQTCSCQIRLYSKCPGTSLKNCFPNLPPPPPLKHGNFFTLFLNYSNFLNWINTQQRIHRKKNLAKKKKKPITTQSVTKDTDFHYIFSLKFSVELLTCNAVGNLYGMTKFGGDLIAGPVDFTH